MLPVVLFLGLRPSPLPNTVYLQTIRLHKWVSRLVVLTGLVHTIAYLVHFGRKKTLAKTFKFLNFLGVITMFLMIVLGISSLKPIRRRFYSIFYYIHYPLAWLSVILGSIHARPGVNFLTFWCIALLLGQLVYRYTSSKTVKVEEEKLTKTLKVVTLPRYALPEYYTVGSHIRLSNTLKSPLTWISPTHPYTIASHPSDSEVKLLVRESKFKIEFGSEYSVCGPFPATYDDNFLTTAENVLLFAGGAGLSFAATIYRALEMNGVPNLRLVWILRSKDEAKAMKLLGLDKAIIYITGDKVFSDHANMASNSQSDYDFELEELLDDEEEFKEADNLTEDAFETFEPQEVVKEDSLISNASTLDGASSTDFNGAGLKVSESNNVEFHRGRPDIETLIQQFFLNSNVSDSSWAIACGPEGLVNDVENVSNNTGIRFIGEIYAL